MRLIDADKIRYSDLSDGHVPEGVWCTWKDRIDAMPIVEAIPIEWLKNELIPKVEKLGATTYVDNIKFVLEDWNAWKRYRG